MFYLSDSSVWEGKHLITSHLFLLSHRNASLPSDVPDSHPLLLGSGQHLNLVLPPVFGISRSMWISCTCVINLDFSC